MARTSAASVFPVPLSPAKSGCDAQSARLFPAKAPGLVDRLPVADVVGNQSQRPGLGRGKNEVVPASERLQTLCQPYELGTRHGPAHVPESGGPGGAGLVETRCGARDPADGSTVKLELVREPAGNFAFGGGRPQLRCPGSAAVVTHQGRDLETHDRPCQRGQVRGPCCANPHEDGTLALFEEPSRELVIVKVRRFGVVNIEGQGEQPPLAVPEPGQRFDLRDHRGQQRSVEPDQIELELGGRSPGDLLLVQPIAPRQLHQGNPLAGRPAEDCSDLIREDSPALGRVGATVICLDASEQRGQPHVEVVQPFEVVDHSLIRPDGTSTRRLPVLDDDFDQAIPP